MTAARITGYLCHAPKICIYHVYVNSNTVYKNHVIYIYILASNPESDA